jgi:hypothetical protein
MTQLIWEPAHRFPGGVSVVQAAPLTAMPLRYTLTGALYMPTARWPVVWLPVAMKVVHSVVLPEEGTSVPVRVSVMKWALGAKPWTTVAAFEVSMELAKVYTS